MHSDKACGRNVGSPIIEAKFYSTHDERNRLEVAEMKNLFTIISYNFSLLIKAREDPGRCHINN